MITNNLEARVLEKGTQLLERADRFNRRNHILTRRYWDEKFLDMIMTRESLKVQLLRYIDTYPALKTYSQKLNHLMQYLDTPSVLEDKLIKLFVSFLKFHPFPLDQCYGVATSLGVWIFAHKFIAGTNPAATAEYIGGLKHKNMTCTLDILGEAVLSEKEALEYTKRYCELLKRVGRLLKDSGTDFQLNVSVKPSSFYSQFKPSALEKTTDNVSKRLARILETAREIDAFVNLDIEQYEYRDTTLHIFENLVLDPRFKDYPHLGMVVQAYLKDALPFTRCVIELARRRGTPFTVRLVKGAYWDYEIIHARQLEWPIPVYLEKWQSDARFEQLTRLLLDNYPAVRLAIGSHNVRSISHGMAYAAEKNIPQHDIEFQMLYGMGDDIKEAIAAMKYPLRVYAPYGELIPGMSYLVRRILENTSNESFLRQRSAQALDAGHLLQNPLELARNEHDRTEFSTVQE